MLLLQFSYIYVFMQYVNINAGFLG